MVSPPLRPTWPHLLRLSASAAMMNAAVPLGLALQIALAGRLGGVSVQAAFGLVVTTTGLGATVFNFLVDGVTAKVGKSVGARRWDESAGRVRMALAAAVVCGCAATILLLSLRRRIFDLFGADDDVSSRARLYYLFRASAVPLQTAASAATGCLGGYGRVHPATALGVGRASMEVVGVALALLARGQGGAEGAGAEDGGDDDGGGVMLAMGIVYVACVAVHACAGVGLVLGLVPRGAPARLRIVGSGRCGQRRDARGSDDEVREGSHTASRTTTNGQNLSEVLDFVSDGMSMLIRSLLLQGSFFVAMVVASRQLDAHGLAAHHVVCQLWMLSSYLVDGFATAGTVLGSRLVGVATKAFAPPSNDSVDASATNAEKSDDGDDVGARVLSALRSVCHRLLLLGLLTGLAFAASLTLARDPLIALFTSDPSTAAALRSGPLWRLLSYVQPLNALVFVYDGLIYAFQEFGYVRELLEVGVGYAFLPALAWVTTREGDVSRTLAGIWAAKVALNAWRAGGLAMRVHGWLLTERGLRSHARRSAWEAAEAASAALGASSSKAGERGGDKDRGEEGSRGANDSSWRCGWFRRVRSNHCRGESMEGSNEMTRLLP